MEDDFMVEKRKCQYSFMLSNQQVERLVEASILLEDFFIAGLCLTFVQANEKEKLVIISDEQEMMIEVSSEARAIEEIHRLSAIRDESIKGMITSKIINWDAVINFTDTVTTRDQEASPKLILTVRETKAHQFTIDYLFDESLSQFEIEIFHRHYTTLLNSLVANLTTVIQKLPVVSEFERDVIRQINQTEVSYSDDKCVHHLIEDVACRYPDKIALKYEEQAVSYAELNQRGNQIANHLTELGVQAGDFVGLCAARGIELISAFLGIMKTGAAYIPMSIDFPEDRRTHMLFDSQAKVVLTTFPDFKAEGVVVSQLGSEAIVSQSIAYTSLGDPKGIAAVIYTSGTTGTPKGVLIRHNTVVNYCEYNLREFAINEQDVITQFAPFTFSTVIYEIATTLFAGARLCLVKDETIVDIKGFHEYIYKEEVNIMLLPAQYAGYLQLPPQIRIIETGASECRPEISEKISQTATHLNAYGLTEGSIVTVWESDSSQPTPKRIPIGRPVANTKAYVLNGYQEQGLYMPGELCVTGLAVADGYLNLPELTEKRFVDNPFGEGSMLRTGDIVQWTYDGNIEYIGRSDNQVKIRGMRVELEEVEFKLSQLSLITNAAVIAKQDEFGDDYLVAFIVSQEQMELTTLKKQLAEILVSYMVPSFIMQIEELPTSANGKVDKQQLASLVIERTVPYVMPHSKEEEGIVEIFEEVLQASSIGINDNFFDEGGHSLRVTKLLNLIEERFGTRLAVADIFDLLTPKAIAVALNSETSKKFEIIERVAESPNYPMSSAQQRLFFVNQLENQSTAYNLTYLLAIKGPIDLQLVQQTVQALFNRHDILRTGFELIDGQAVQVVSPHLVATVGTSERLDLNLTHAQQLMNDSTIFDLSKAPLIDFEIVRLANEETAIIVNMHHIISDGMTLNILMEEFSALYNQEKLASPTLQYKDYSAWMANRNLSQQKNFWLNQFEGEVPVLDMPLDNQRPLVQSYRSETLQTTIDSQLKEKILKLSKASGVTEYMIFLSALMILLSKYSRQEEIIVGSPISGRTHRDTESMLGFFVNSLAIKGQPVGDKRFQVFLNEIKETCLAAYENQDYPFEQLVESLDLPRDLSHNPLFDVMLVVQNNEKVELSLKDTDVTVIAADETAAKYDLTLTITENDNQYDVAVNFATDLFNSTTISSFNEHLLLVLDQITQEQVGKLETIKTATPEEEKRILAQFNQPGSQVRPEATMVELFEEQVVKEPHKVAVIFDDSQLTYEELNQRANQVAHTLRDRGIQPNDYVALLTDRSLEMYISILGVIKAGAAYVPINIYQPIERIHYILDDLSPSAVITYGASLEPRANLMSWESGLFDKGDSRDLERVNQPSDALYVIYTSGTTGKPKGVILEHRNGVNYCLTNRLLGSAIEELNEGAIVSVTDYSFDIFFTECLYSLVNSLKVILASETQMMDPMAFAGLLENQKESALVLQITPAKMKFFASTSRSTASMAKVKVVVLGGEIFPTDMYAFITSFCQARVFNAYGPSETTVFSTIIEITGEDVTIGRPENNNQIYLHSASGLAGIGVPGEIAIAGPGVGRGYLNQSGLTEKHFISNPYGDGTAYLSGDLARWLPDGRLDYLERVDNQVKIRGYRIELDEIATVIRRYPSVVDATVVVRQQGKDNDQLYGYFVATTEVNIEKLKQELSKELPDYMVPNYLKQIFEIPMNSSGKVAKARLPEIHLEKKKEDSVLGSKTEQKIANVFKAVLDVEQIGSASHFFDLGGNSLRLTSLANLIEKEVGVRMPLRTLFAHPTVAEIADLVDEQNVSSTNMIPQADKASSYPMSSAQKRLFVINQLDESAIAYNMPALLKLSGQLDYQRLTRVFQQMIERHEVLRTRFMLVDNHPVQIIDKTVKAEVTRFNYQQGNPEKVLADLVQPFDLAKAPLMRVGISSQPEETYLFVDVHHLISDGFSAAILLEEFSQLYAGVELVPLTSQYKDYSEWLSQRELSQQKAYWQKELSDLPILNLPLDYQRPTQQSYQGRTISTTLSKELSSQLNQLALKTETTPYMVFLGTYMMLLSKYSQQSEVIVGSPISGRNHAETESMLGMFVNTLALKGAPEGEKILIEFLQEVKNTCLDAYDNQEFPFEEMVEFDTVTRDLSRNPVFDVMFVMQNNQLPTKRFATMAVETTEIAVNVAKFDLTVSVAETEGRFKLEFNFSTALFNEASVSVMMTHFKELLSQLEGSLSLPINQISVVSAAEKTQLLQDFNQPVSSVDYLTVNQLFNQVVDHHQNKVALVMEEQQLTYAELNQEATNLGASLQGMGVKVGDYVGVIATRSFESIISWLGIIKAGAIYVPIDPTFPEARQQYILTDCRPKVILTNISDLQLATEIPVFVVQTLKNQPQAIYSPIITDLEDILYCIYTSGTTGQPKGVLVKQLGLLNLQTYFKNGLQVTDQDHILQFANAVFDASIWEISMALFHGGTLHLATSELIEDLALMTTYLDERITVATLPPQYVANLSINQLRLLITAGSSANVEVFKQHRGRMRLINAYGPSETTICGTAWEVPATGELPLSIPIGQPIDNTQAYIMTDQQLAGIGIPGELCLAGLNVGHGYLNRPELTSEQFVANPFGEGNMYRTGDLARWLPDGSLEYLGREDFQVKIRGYRIELSEIEYALRQEVGVADAVVITRNDPAELVAYVVPSNQGEVVVDLLKHQLGLSLPAYMIPNQILMLEAIPVTVNGKVDVTKLPMLSQSEKVFVAPSTAEEELVTKVFQTILKLPQISVQDDFFEIGGDSIKAIRIVSQVREEGYETSVKDILQGKTIQQIALRLQLSSEQRQYEQGEIVGKVKLTPIQQDFFAKNYAKPNHFNQSVMLESNQPLNQIVLESALLALLSHHDNLRSVFRDQSQEILTSHEAQLDFEVFEYSTTHQVEVAIEKQSNRRQLSIELEAGPLMKVALYQTKKGSFVMITIHHLVVDAVSWHILLEDLESGYQQGILEQTIQLPQKTASIREWADELTVYGQEINQQELAYWQEVVTKGQSLQMIEASTNENAPLSQVTVKIGAELTRQLLFKTNQAYQTEINDLLLAAMGLAVRSWQGNKIICVELEGHGRQSLATPLSIDRTVGWFTSLYPIIVEVEDTIATSIIAVKEMLRKVPNHGIGFGLIKYQQKNLIDPLQPTFGFNYLGQIDNQVQENGYFKRSEVTVGQMIAPENKFKTGLLLTASVVNKELTMTVDYNQAVFNERDIIAFSQLYETVLTDVIAHCSGQQISVTTPSDIGAGDIDINELALINDLLSDL